MMSPASASHAMWWSVTPVRLRLGPRGALRARTPAPAGPAGAPARAPPRCGRRSPPRRPGSLEPLPGPGPPLPPHLLGDPVGVIPEQTQGEDLEADQEKE